MLRKNTWSFYRLEWLFSFPKEQEEATWRCHKFGFSLKSQRRRSKMSIQVKFYFTENCDYWLRILSPTTTKKRMTKQIILLSAGILFFRSSKPSLDSRHDIDSQNNTILTTIPDTVDCHLWSLDLWWYTIYYMYMYYMNICREKD